MLLHVIINVLLLLVSECFSQDLPSYFPRCELDDPDLNNCIGRAANALRPYIRKGIEEIKFPCLDPLVVSTMKGAQESDAANYTITVWNYVIRGLDNYDLTEVRYDPKTLTFKGTVQVDSLSITSGYMMQGRILSIYLDGMGDTRVDFGPIQGTFEINGKIVKRKGIEYYKPTKTKLKLTIEDGGYYYGGLYGGDKERERVTNDLLNQSSKLVTAGLTPVFEKASELGLMHLMKSLTRTVPYDKLFPRSSKQQTPQP